MGRRKKKSQRDEDSNADADQIPEKYRENVLLLKEMFNRTEQEIYFTLKECNMKTDIALDHLLAEEKDNESRIVQNLKKLVNCSEEKIQEVLLECNMDANEALNRLLSQDHILEDKREIIQKLMNIVNCSKQEIYAVLLECNMDADKAVNSLLSQGSGNKFSSDGKETSDVQGIHDHLADSSTTSDNLGCEPPLNSDVSDVNTNKVPLSLDDAVSSLSVSSSLDRGAHGKRIMGIASSSKENVTKAPEKPDVPKAVPSLSVSSSSGRGANDKRIMSLASSSKENVPKAPEKPGVPMAVPSLSVSSSLCYAEVVKKGLASSEENVTKARPTVVAPVEQSLQRQSINTLVDAMRQQGDPQNSASPLSQSMPSVSSLTEMNEQDISHHYSQPEVPFTVGHSGSASSSTNSSAHSSTYPSPIGSTNGSTYSSAHGSAFGSPSSAAYTSSVWSDNAANLRHVSDDEFSSQIANNLASLLQPNENSNVWGPRGHNNSGNNTYRLFMSRDQNQQSPSSIPIQPQQQQQQQIYQSPSGAAYGSSMWSDNAANLIHESDDDLKSRLANNLASLIQKSHDDQNLQSPSFIPIQPQQHQNQQSPSSIPIQPQQQQQHQNQQSPSFIPIQPQQLQHQNHQSPSFIPFQPQQQHHQIHQSPSFIPFQSQLQHQNHQFKYSQPQQLQHQNYQFRSYFQPQQLQHQNYQFRSYFQPQQLQHQNHQFRPYFQPQQLQHQNHQFRSCFQPQQQQQHQIHQSPSFGHIQQQQRQQQQQQQQQENNMRDPSKQTQKETGPRNNCE